MALVQAYAADCTEGVDRVTLLGRIHACMYLGIAVGPAAGQLFVRTVGKGDMLSVFYAAMLCHAGFIAFVMFAIEESLPSSYRAKRKSYIPTADASPTLGPSTIRSRLMGLNIFPSLNILRPPLETSSLVARRNLPLLACIDGIAFGIQLGLASLLILYSEHKFDWKTPEASLFVSITNATRAIILTWIVPIIPRLTGGRSPTATTDTHLEIRDTSTPVLRITITTIRAALLIDLMSLTGVGMTGSTVLFTLLGVAASAGALVSPLAQSLMTTYVEVDRIGELLGTVSLFHALARSLIPAFMQFVYGMTVADYPGAVFCVPVLLFGDHFRDVHATSELAMHCGIRLLDASRRTRKRNFGVPSQPFLSPSTAASRGRTCALSILWSGSLLA